MTIIKNGGASIVERGVTNRRQPARTEMGNDLAIAVVLAAWAIVLFCGYLVSVSR